MRAGFRVRMLALICAVLGVSGGAFRFVLETRAPATASSGGKFVDVEAGLELSDLFEPGVARRLRSDLALLKRIHGRETTPLFRRIFGSFGRGDLYRWFEERIVVVEPGECGSASAVACYKGGSPWMMRVTDVFATTAKPAIARLGTLLHEARHAEGFDGAWPHALCPDPFVDGRGNPCVSSWSGVPLAGLPGCDAVADGSYGAEAVFLMNVALHCQTCAREVRAQARHYAIELVDRIVDEAARAELRRDFGLESAPEN